MSDRGGASLPGNPPQLPGLPENFLPVVWEKFETLNTKSPRPAISEGEFFWGDGWMPVGPSNLRILPGVGPIIYSAPANISVEWMGFGNIADTSYGYIELSNGSVVQFDTTTGGTTAVMAPGTIQTPTSIFGFSQWGSQYIVFAKDQDNGYWLWDGTNQFTAGTVAPTVTLDNAGSNYDGSPVVIQLQTTGSGVGEVFAATVMNGSVETITVENPGSGFGINDFAVLNITGGGSDDQAYLGVPTVTTNAGGLAQVYIIDGGSRYTARASASISGGGGSGASISLAIQNGVITQAAIVNAGTGYTSAPSISINDPGIPGSGGSAIPGGSGGSLGCSVSFGQITAIPVAIPGSGYVSVPTVNIIGDGTGATALAEISGGQVTSIMMTANGTGYTKALAEVQGGNNAANATVTLMPFGISGTAVEIAFQRVWVTNGGATANDPPQNRTLYSSANSPDDFSSSGGAFASTDSFLRVGYHWLKQTNGFLYLGGDSSINYISNVQSSGTPAVTTFGNLNVDPQLGSPWPSSVQVFSRNIVFANTIGIFVSYGGAVTKASLPLDGFYFQGPIYNQTANYSSAVAHIFGIPVYMLLLPVVDQFTGQLVNKLLMWDGKRWFTSQQDRALTFIATQEINSVLTAWGTDGTNVFRLFQAPSVGFSKVVQSKLFATPSYMSTKTARSLSGVIQAYNVDETITVTIDNELGIGSANAAVTFTPAQGIVPLINNVGATVALTNNVAATVIINGGPGIDVFGPISVGQFGRMQGFTVQTNASDLALLSVGLVEQIFAPNV